MDLQVLEPIKNPIKTFNSPVEFNLWYAKHKEEIGPLTTHKLNKLYHIDDYRITKIKGALMLKKDPKLKMKESEETLNDEIDELRDEIKNIKDTMNKLIQYIQGTMNVSPPLTT